MSRPKGPDRSIGDFLADFSLFSKLSAEEIEKLAAHAKFCEFQSGAALLRQGDHAHGFFLILSGQVKVSRESPGGRESILHIVQPGSVVGEAPVFHQGTWPTSAIALTPVMTIYIEGQKFLSMIDESPKMARLMLAVLSRRLRMLTHKLTLIQAQDSSAWRVASWLTHRARLTGKTVIPLEVTREVLARSLGLARETFSRELSKLAKDGLIKISRSEIAILNSKALQDMTDGKDAGGSSH